MNITSPQSDLGVSVSNETHFSSLRDKALKCECHLQSKGGTRNRAICRYSFVRYERYSLTATINYRHNSYPNDTRGDFLDAIHAFFNYEKKREMDYSVSESVIGKEIISQNSNIKYYELIKVIESNEKFFNHCEGVEKDYCRVAPLFLKLKRFFYDGIKPDKTYCGMEIEKFIKSTGNYNQNDFIKALYLLGIVLGRDNTYQYLYFKQGHPILKNKE